MQSVDDVHLSQCLIAALTQLVPGLLQRHRIGTRITGLEPGKRTEQTARHADVRGFESKIVIEESVVPVPSLTFAVGQPPDGEQIGTSQKLDAVFETQPSTSVEFRSDVF